MHRYSHTLLIYIGSSRVVALLVCMLLFASCQDRRTYSHYTTVAVDGWERNDTLTFAIPPQHAGTYELQIGLRATNAYPFTHLSMLMEQTCGIKVRRDTVRCQITDAKGLLLGKNGISSSEITYHIADINLKEGDSLTIKFNHCMERDPISGISDMGVELLTH